MTLKGEKESHRRGTDTPVFSAARRKDTHRPRYYETPFRRVHALRVVFPRGLAARRARDEDVRRVEGEATRGKKRAREKEGGRGRETHVRATTMYFGAALHTPRGGQCPSLLRLKEGAEGREGWREQGRGEGRGRFAVEREVGRQGGGHRRGVEKNEQTSSERDGGGESCRGTSRCALSLLSPFFSLPLLSSFSLSPPLSLSLRLSLFLDCPSVSLHDASPAAATDFLLPERFPLNVKIRSSTARSLFLLFCLSLSFSARLISRTHTSIIRAL